MILLFIAIVFLNAIVFPVVAYTQGMPADQKSLYAKGIKYYDICNPSGSGGQDITAGTGEATGLRFPNLDPESMANAIDTYIKKYQKNSPLLGVGKITVASAKNADVNPFLIIGIANKESSLGTAGTLWNTANNVFGRTATARQPHIASGDRLWYKWVSIKASVDYTDPSHRNDPTKSGDEASYLKAVYGDAISSNDIDAFFAKYAPSHENNTSLYIQQMKGWISEMADLAGSSDSLDSGSSGGGSGATETTTPAGENVTYKAAGNIPATGKVVGASIYGGNWNGNSFVPNSADDNGDSASGPQKGHAAFAELSIDHAALDYSALGKLPYGKNPDGSLKGTKLEITYKGKRIIAQKYDVGRGGDPVKGKRNDIDLWWETAKLLNFKDGKDILKIRPVADDTPVTPVDGSATDVQEQKSSTSCVPVCAPSDTVGDGRTVVLDPGHSGVDKQGQEKDPGTGLWIGDSSNPDERRQVWETAEKIKAKLEPDGYKVIMTKNSEDDYVNLRDRAFVANKAKAAIAVSIHNTPGTFGSSSTGWVTPQEVGGYRGSGTDKKTFTNKSVADKSKQYADAILEERKKSEGDVQMHKLNFDNRAGLSPGDISIVQLYAKVPWIYNEVGQSGFNSDKYADGIAAGIKKALPLTGAPTVDGATITSGDAECSSGVASGDIAQTAINFSWEDGRSTLTPKPEYKQAVQKYNPSAPYAGADCGAFVGTVMRASGADPDYPLSFTPDQEDYVKNSGKYEIVRNTGSTSILQPGDILIVNGSSGGSGADGHTYIFTGNHGVFNAAGASMGSKMPHMHNAFLSDYRGDYTIARLK